MKTTTRTKMKQINRKEKENKERKSWAVQTRKASIQTLEGKQIHVVRRTWCGCSVKVKGRRLVRDGMGCHFPLVPKIFWKERFSKNRSFVVVAMRMLIVPGASVE